MTLGTPFIFFYSSEGRREGCIICYSCSLHGSRFIAVPVLPPSLSNHVSFHYRPYAMGRTQLIFLYTLRKYLFLEMGWRGKHDFTVLNNGVLRKGNDLVKRQNACETFTYNILQGYYMQSQPEGWFWDGQSSVPSSYPPVSQE